MVHGWGEISERDLRVRGLIFCRKVNSQTMKSTSKVVQTQTNGRINPTILQAALVGLKQQQSNIEANIAEVEAMLRAGGVSSHTLTLREVGRIGKPLLVPKTTPTTTTPTKRTMSAAGKAAIRAAVRRRWAAFHAGKAHAPTSKTAHAPKTQPKPKRAPTVAQLEAMRQNARKARKAAAKARRLRVVPLRKAS